MTQHSHQTAPTQLVDANGIRFAYLRFGNAAGVRDRAYGAAVPHRLRATGIRDEPIAPGSPWQNGFAERLIGSRRILWKYAAYYNELRTHRSLGKDAPIPIVPSSTQAGSRRSRSWVAFTTIIVEFS